jgi:hypothetical protein
MKIILSESTLEFISRFKGFFPKTNVPSSGNYPNNSVVAGFLDWVVKGSDASVTFKFNDYPSSAVGNSVEIYALPVQTMELSHKYNMINLGSVTIDQASTEKTLVLSGLTASQKYWIIIRAENFVPYSTNEGHAYKALGGSISIESGVAKISPSDPGASGEGSYGAFIPACVQLKVN